MLLQQVINDDAPSPRKLNSSIPVDLETICLKCLEKTAGSRYQSAQDLADDLTRWLNKGTDRGPSGQSCCAWCSLVSASSPRRVTDLCGDRCCLRSASLESPCSGTRQKRQRERRKHNASLLMLRNELQGKWRRVAVGNFTRPRSTWHTRPGAMVISSVRKVCWRRSVLGSTRRTCAASSGGIFGGSARTKVA